MKTRESKPRVTLFAQAAHRHAPVITLVVQYRLSKTRGVRDNLIPKPPKGVERLGSGTLLRRRFPLRDVQYETTRESAAIEFARRVLKVPGFKVRAYSFCEHCDTRTDVTFTAAGDMRVRTLGGVRRKYLAKRARRWGKQGSKRARISDLANA